MKNYFLDGFSALFFEAANHVLRLRLGHGTDALRHEFPLGREYIISGRADEHAAAEAPGVARIAEQVRKVEALIVDEGPGLVAPGLTVDGQAQHRGVGFPVLLVEKRHVVNIAPADGTVGGPDHNNGPFSLTDEFADVVVLAVHVLQPDIRSRRQDQPRYHQQHQDKKPYSIKHVTLRSEIHKRERDAFLRRHPYNSFT